MSKKKTFKKDEDGMTRPVEIIDNAMQESLDAGQSKEDWLDYLRGLRDELDIAIENVENEIEDER